MTFIGYIFSATIFSLLGVSIFAVSFWFVDRITPFDLWKEIVEDKNMALAVLAGSGAIAIGLIVASAIHS